MSDAKAEKRGKKVEKKGESEKEEKGNEEKVAWVETTVREK